MSVCVDAQLWQTCVSGIITAQSGCGQQLDHAVQAVGYGALSSPFPLFDIQRPARAHRLEAS